METSLVFFSIQLFTDKQHFNGFETVVFVSILNTLLNCIFMAKSGQSKSNGMSDDRVSTIL